MKRLLAMLLVAALALSACSSSPSSSETSSENASDTSQSSSAADETSEDEPSAEESSKDEASAEAYEVTYSHATSYKDSIGTVWMQAIVEIENTGSSDLFLSTGNMDIEDANGKLITSRTMVSCYPNVISPGEKGYYYESTTLNDLDEAIDLVVIPRPDIKAAKVDKITLNISEDELANKTYGGLSLKGRIENPTSEEQKLVYIAAVLFDAQDVPIGLMFTIITDPIKAGDKIGFEMSSSALPSDVTLDRVARYEIFAYPTQFQF